MQQAQAAQTGQPPPQVPPPPPEIAAILSNPTWEEVVAVLKNDLQRNYKIDIETNSTIELEATEDKQQIGEFLNAMAQFLNGISPLVTAGQLPFEAMKEMLLAVVRRFRFGTDVEEQLKQMKAPPPPADPKQQENAAKMQAEQKSAEMDLQAKQIDIQLKQLEAQARQQALQVDAAIQQAEFQAKLRELARKDQLAQAQMQSKLRLLQMREQTATAAAASTSSEGGSGDAAV